MKTKAQIGVELEQKRTALAALFALHTEGTEIKSSLPMDEVKTLNTEIEDLTKSHEQMTQAEAMAKANAAQLAELTKNVSQHRQPTVNADEPTVGRKAIVVPATVRRIKTKAFTGTDANEKAFAFGHWFLATSLGNEKSRKFCLEHGLPMVREVDSKAHSEAINSSGGFLVPDIFENDMIDLREQFGVFRQLARRRPMTSDSSSRPRRKGGLTAYAVGEQQTITESTKAWDRVKLVAKKIAVLSRMSNELNEDSVIDLGDDLAQEINYAFAQYEDQAGFNGDGTSPYSNVVGVRQSLLGLNGTIANIAGLQVGSGTGYAAAYNFLLSDFNSLMGRLPQYADTPNAGWICHKAFFNGVMQRLEFAGGGNTELNIAKGNRDKMFLGYPVHVSQVMPSNSAVSQVVCLFGDLALAADFGDRRQSTIAISEHLNFDQDELVIRGTERFDINVHDVGNASGTAALRQAGPIVGLITGAS